MLARHGIETLVPNEAEKTFIHDTIYEELVKDVFNEETRRGYVKIVDDRHGPPRDVILTGLRT